MSPRHLVDEPTREFRLPAVLPRHARPQSLLGRCHDRLYLLAVRGRRFAARLSPAGWRGPKTYRFACPSCRRPLRSLLDECPNPPCVTAANNIDAHLQITWDES